MLSMLTASRPAFVAPELPTAVVATGMPPGICTMESSESQPESAWERTGTPMTGNVVCAATIPGRWAAPPAPAMMILSPLARALCANSPMSSGVRCAETTCFMYGTSKRSSISQAYLMVSQSLAEPIITATCGLFAVILPPAHVRPHPIRVGGARLTLTCSLYAKGVSRLARALLLRHYLA